MKILFLYSKVMAYTVALFEELVKTYNAELHIVYWDHKGDAPYTPRLLESVTYYKRSEYPTEKIRQLSETIDPQMIYIVGWTDWDYLKIVKPFKSKGIPVVIGFDDIWYGTLRQKLGALIFPFMRKYYYSHAWVSGPRQYEFAKRLGFTDDKITYYLFSANSDLFHKAFENLSLKQQNYPKSFLFVGRFAPFKAIDVLAEAYKIYQKKYNGNWKLICIGTGKLKHHLENIENVEVRDYSSQEEIFNLLNNVGAFVLPSRHDVSPLVVHEFTSAGLPIILSKNIGNRALFLIDNFNGFSFVKESAEDLATKMFKMSTLSTERLLEMGNNSYLLSRQHHVKYVAASFMSILYDKD